MARGLANGRVVLGLLLATGGWACTPPDAPPPVPPPNPVPRVGPDATTSQPVSRPTESIARPAHASLVVSPTRATLLPGDPGLQLLVSATADPGEVTWLAEPAGVVAVDPGGYVRPIGPGQATVRGASNGQEVAASIEVVGARQGDRSWDFTEDVAPLFNRLGCNASGCHGRPGGQNGFHLSLFGYDPESDFLAIVRDAGGRRVSSLRWDLSLLLNKATGRAIHGGGQRVAPGSEAETLLAGWLRAGTPERLGKVHGRMVRMTVEPGDVRLGQPGDQQFRVIATYEDGHQRDVTRLALFRSNDDSVVTIDPTGKATMIRRGEADLIVRYQSRTAAVRLSSKINPDLEFDFAALPRRNVIDEKLFPRLESLGVPPSPAASDAAFLRRVKLDLTGEQPDPTEVRQFLDDPDPEKRVAKVDELLKSSDFVRFWLIKLGDMLQISPQRFPNGSGFYQEWLRRKLLENAPWDSVVRELLTALGNPASLDGAPANYALDDPDPKVQAEQTAQRFLGLRLRCAQCHDHPFDIWTQDDYFGLAAFFAKVDRSSPMGPNMGGRVEVRVNPDGKVEHLRTHQPAEPRLPGVGPVPVADDADPRVALADWMTRPDNPYFARATANWVWAQCFGKGLVDPPDDLSIANPPVHPELLDAMAREFVKSGFDLRALVRLVATSHAYELSSAAVPGNEQDARLFSHQSARPLTAHQMADALAQATNVKDKYRLGGTGGQLVEKRAIEINDPSTPSAVLDAFGRCARTNGCSPVATPTLSLRQALLVIGGTVIESKVGHLQGYLSRVLELAPEPADLVENLYLRTVCRRPTAEESAFAVEQLDGKSGQELREAAEDLFWALLNSREFAFNH